MIYSLSNDTLAEDSFDKLDLVIEQLTTQIETF